MLGLVDHWQHCLILKVEFRRRGRAWGADCMYITKRSSWSLSGEWIEECSEWIKGNQLGGHCNILSWRGGGLVKGGGSIGEKWVDLRGILKQRLTGLVGGSATQTRGGMYQRWLRGFWLGNMKEWWCQSLRLYAKCSAECRFGTEAAEHKTGAISFVPIQANVGCDHSKSQIGAFGY